VRAGVHDADIGGEIVLLHPDDGAYFALNETGAHLWRQLGPEATPRADAIRRATDTLTARWPVDGDQATADLRELLDELIDRGLVDVAP
jgi:hypothetical protein